MMTTRHLSLLTAGALILGMSTFTAVPARAAVPTCDGLPVTMEVTYLSGVVEATQGDDVILVTPTSGDAGGVPTPFALAVFAVGGNDTVCLVSGGAAVYGGAGDDTIDTTRGGGLLDGGPGNDVLRDGSAGSELVGDSGNDQLYGGRGRDLLLEGTGVNGDDVVDGGLGVDTVSFQDLDHGVTVDATTGTYSGFGNDAVSGVEDWSGTTYDDTLIGSDANDLLYGGGGGDDRLVGGPGDDMLSSGALPFCCATGVSDRGTTSFDGGAGNDRILSLYHGSVSAGAGNDRVSADGGGALNLGPGNDRVDVDHDSGSARSVRITGGSGRDHIAVRGTPDRPDEYRGGTGADVLEIEFGGGAGNTIDGRVGIASYRGVKVWFRFAGLETLIGTGGDDTMIGGPGPQTLLGSYGRDLLLGGAGNDTIVGGPGRDVSRGGPGRDVCDAEVEHSCEKGLTL